MPQQRAVSDEEILGRFILSGRLRPSASGQVPPEAFLPYKRVELSVTRHIGLTNHRLWACGKCVSKKRNLPLYGRADVAASVPRNRRLDVLPSEPPRNHANIVGWPPEKPAQMSYAIDLAAAAVYTPVTE